MSNVVILPDDGQADTLKALLADVTKVAGSEPVALGFGGVVVSRPVAKKFLGARGGDDAETSGHTVDNTRTPLITRSLTGDTDRQAVERPEGTVIGGRTPSGALPGGYEGVPADERRG